LAPPLADPYQLQALFVKDLPAEEPHIDQKYNKITQGAVLISANTLWLIFDPLCDLRRPGIYYNTVKGPI
jgi:hypothetical protein